MSRAGQKIASHQVCLKGVIEMSRFALLLLLVSVPMSFGQGGGNPDGSERPKIAIFYHYIGGGHKTVAEGIAEDRRAKGQEVVLISNEEILRTPFVGRLDRALYRKVVRWFPASYHASWWAQRTEEGLEREGLAWPLRAGFGTRSLAQRIQKEAPSEIIATDEFSAELLVTARLQGLLPTHTRIAWVITDFTTLYPTYVLKGMDRVMVGHPDLRQELLQRGLDPARVHATAGIPLSIPRHVGQRRVYGEIPRVVLGAGAFGAIDLVKIVQQIESAAVRPVQVAVLCGNSEANFRSLTRLGKRLAKVQLIPFGEIPREMALDVVAAADVFVSKAGGIAPMEAIRLGVPTVLFDAFGGNEGANLKFLADRGVVLPSAVPEIGAKVQLLLDHPDLRDALREAEAGFLRVAEPEPGAPLPVQRVTQTLEESVRAELREITAWIHSEQAERLYLDEISRVARSALSDLSAEEAQAIGVATFSRLKQVQGGLSMLKDFVYSYGRLGGITFAAIHIVKNVLIAFPMYGLAAWTGDAGLLATTVVIHQGPWDFLGALGLTSLSFLKDRLWEGAKLRWEFGLWSLAPVRDALREAVGSYEADEVVLSALNGVDARELFLARRPARPDEVRVSLQAIEAFVMARPGGKALIESLGALRGRTEIYAQVLLNHFADSVWTHFEGSEIPGSESGIELYLRSTRQFQAEASLQRYALSRVLKDVLALPDLYPGRAARVFGAIPIPLVQVVRALGRWAPVRHGLQALTRMAPQERQAQELVAEFRGQVGALVRELRAFEQEVAFSELRTVYLESNREAHGGASAELERLERKARDLQVRVNHVIKTANTFSESGGIASTRSDLAKVGGVMNMARHCEAYLVNVGQKAGRK